MNWERRVELVIKHVVALCKATFFAVMTVLAVLWMPVSVFISVYRNVLAMNLITMFYHGLEWLVFLILLTLSLFGGTFVIIQGSLLLGDWLREWRKRK